MASGPRDSSPRRAPRDLPRCVAAATISFNGQAACFTRQCERVELVPDLVEALFEKGGSRSRGVAVEGVDLARRSRTKRLSALVRSSGVGFG